MTNQFMNLLSLKTFSQSRYFHPMLLLASIAVGIVLRFSRLEAKPIWTDEFATIVFSLGNTFHSVPLDRSIAPDVLFQPLQPQLKDIGDAIERLFNESTHPPLYFAIAHLWLKLFAIQSKMVLLWASRTLSVLFGVATIPAMYGFAWLAFRSRVVAQLAAAMMAISPYSIFLAQEARHYTLATLFIVASLSFFVVTINYIEKRSPLPAWVGFSWVAVNSLGIATHYFFTLSLVIQGLVLSVIWIKNKINSPLANAPLIYWWRIVAVALGTLAGGLVWLPVWQNIHGSELTRWVYQDPLRNFLLPAIRLCLWANSMLSMLPVDIFSLPLWVVIVFGNIMIIYLIWIVRFSWRGWRWQIKQSNSSFTAKSLGGYVVSMLGLILVLNYGLGTDLTLAPRFQYIYFPVAIALFSYSISAYWMTATGQREFEDKIPLTQPLSPVMIVLLMGLMGGITIVGNFGYLQHERCDIVAKSIHNESQMPVLIASTHKHHGNTGRMMGIAWELNRLNQGTYHSSPLFLLAHNYQGLCKEAVCNDPNNDPGITLSETVAKLPRPLDVWVVNFHAPILIENQNCTSADARWRKVEGYRFRRYECR
ncbi:glycosyltransferase family 39 protein [Aerosakkonema funiforme]|uniref:glycosyltransferase family 39 protein n=1 Tax=Aerosakkonema funiforme TaxID=1246630 RepID=UPI0035B814D2